MNHGTTSSVPAAHKASLIGLLVTLGIVYGDIGTSPLYVMKAILGATPHPTPQYVIGALSCIIWTLTLQATVKYVLIALRADNRNEGGILALYALVRRSRRKWLYVAAIVGASTLVADGVITPAMTVVSATEGLQLISPDVPVVPISMGIIVLLFFVQQFGTSLIGKSFGPLMLVWFLMIGLLGAVHLGNSWQVLQAFNPVWAVRLLYASPEWFLIMGAVFLCTTGAEALYSDLGHCGRGNIHITWVFVKLMLILNYLGQGAWTIAHLDSLSAGLNPFYAIMPRWFLLPGIVMATIAAVIASQALISGSFTIFSEAMNLNFWPRQKIKYPSNIKGQLYIPFINSFLLVACLITVLIFRNSSHMEAAYGLAITITMLMTTLLLAFYLHQKRVNRLLVALFALTFLVIESGFFTANLFKFMHGGWYTLLIAGLIAGTMLVWYNALRLRRRYYVFRSFPAYYGILSDIKRDNSIPHYATNLVYLTRAEKNDEIEGKILYSIINKQPKRADHYWIIYVDYQDEPSTLEYTCEPLIPDTLYRLNMRIGFRIQPYINVFLRQVIEDLVSSGRFDLTSCHPSLRKYDVPGDFHFVVIHRIYYHDDSFGLMDNFIMNLYHLIRTIGISDVKAYGLDTSNVTVEKVPLIVNHSSGKQRIRPAAEEADTEP